MKYKYLVGDKRGGKRDGGREAETFIVHTCFAVIQNPHESMQLSLSLQSITSSADSALCCLLACCINQSLSTADTTFHLMIDRGAPLDNKSVHHNLFKYGKVNRHICKPTVQPTHLDVPSHPTTVCTVISGPMSEVNTPAPVHGDLAALCLYYTGISVAADKQRDTLIIQMTD